MRKLTRLSALVSVIGLLLVTPLSAQASPSAIDGYNYAVSCTIGVGGGYCTTPLLSVNINNEAGVANSIEVSYSSSAYAACTWSIYDQKNNKLIWSGRAGSGSSGHSVVLYNVYSTYKATNPDRCGWDAYVSMQDY